MIALALLPAILLLIYIYKKDNREKEPKKLLLSCFLFGVLSTVSAMLLEIVGGMIFEFSLEVGSVLYAVIDGYVVTAFAEEFSKYLYMKLKTWTSPEFNCSFDGIVYSVFVSLGFAAFENIFYVADGGLSVALSRMFTAVPLHAYTAVFMGYFYSSAKKAALTGNTKLKRRSKVLALLVPTYIHGLYDCLLSVEAEVVGEDVVGACFLVWIVYIVILFFASAALVNKASKDDRYFNYMDELESM